jgi:hypothetical protein
MKHVVSVGRIEVIYPVTRQSLARIIGITPYQLREYCKDANIKSYRTLTARQVRQIIEEFT